MYYSQAWKSAKAALQLLNRSEDLYHETTSYTTGNNVVSDRLLPSVSSYVTVMDVYKALAVRSDSSAELLIDDSKKNRDEALNVWKNLRQRRLEMYRLNNNNDGSGGGSGGGNNNDSAKTTTGNNSIFHILPHDIVKTGSVKDTFDYAYNLLRESSTTYPTTAEEEESSKLLMNVEDDNKIGTYHFNQLIFDLAKYPQPFSGLLAQDLLEYMVYMVSSSSSSSTRFNKSHDNNNNNNNNNNKPNVPKPNVETINGVLKAWMVTPNYPDAVARRVESVLAKLAGWQSDGTLWGVIPDTVSYNTCINCWKESGIPGSAERATEILALMEDQSTNVAPDAISYCSCMSAWAECAATTNPKAAGANAEAILTRMHNRAKENEDAPKPTTRCVNAVLLAYANGKQKGGGKRALELLRFLESLHSQGYPDCQPDSYTFNIVMKALANCKEAGAAEKASQLLRRMEQSYDKGGTLQPDIFSYNIVLDAFSRVGDAESAEKLLEQMYERSERGSIAKPNAHSYTAVLTAWARNGNEKATARAEELFNNFERKYAAGETDVQADTSCYNALINVWAKSGERKALYRVTQILSTMEELGLQGGDESVAPNSRTYCAVLDCLARSRNFKAYNEALEVIQRMEDFHLEGYESVRPCARAYSIVISTIARSRRKDKAVKAQEMLRRMESEYVKGNVAARPTVYSYNGVLNAAAFTSGDERDQEEAFRVACLTFDELRMSEYLQPSHVSYGTFLKAIRKLMPDSEIREKLVTSVFRRCCKEGLVGDMVLREMKALSSPDFYQSLLEGYGTKLGIPPKSFSANVIERDYEWLD
jgi:pentatricopeptide repeat protein